MADNPSHPINVNDEAFYRAIGLCITGWAWVDEGLFQLFSACVHPRPQASIIYYRTPGLDVRLGLTDEIVRSVLPKPERKNGGHDHAHVKDWIALRNEIKDLLETRRRIAHHPVHLSFFGTTDEFGKVTDVNLDATSFEIYVSEHERARNPDKEWEALTLDHLSLHYSALTRIPPRLDRFLSVIVQWYSKPPS